MVRRARRDHANMGYRLVAVERQRSADLGWLVVLALPVLAIGAWAFLATTDQGLVSPSSTYATPGGFEPGVGGGPFVDPSPTPSPAPEIFMPLGPNRDF